MSVRTAYPNIFSEAAEALGIHVFQRIVEVELNGAKFDQDSLVEIDRLQHLQKLVVTRANLSDCNLARFAERRPEVELAVSSTATQQVPLLFPDLAEAVPAQPSKPATTPASNMFSCSVSPSSNRTPSLR